MCGAKSRGNWSSGICLKECIHQGKEDVCFSCVKFSNLNSENPEIFEKKGDSGSVPTIGKESMRFYPHYNNAFGKFIHTKGDYLSEMKKGGFEPYSGEAPKPKRETPDMRPTGDVIRAIEACSNRDGSFSPGSNLKKALMDRGVIMSKESLNKYHRKVEEFKRG